MRRLGVIVGLVCFLSSGILASNDFSGVGNWADPNIWKEGRSPSGAEEVKVRGEDTICTLNTSTGDWGAGQRMRVYEGATLIIEEGAELLGAGWMRVGAGNPGYVEQTGGLVQLQDGKDSAKLGIGDQGGSDGNYTISGGTLTYAEGSLGELLVGARAGTGTLTIIGTGPTIQMNTMIVGDRAGAYGTIEFQVDANGVSPISLVGGASIDPEGDETTAALVINSIGGAPQANVVLLDLPDDANFVGVFDTVNGEPAEDGASVLLTFGEVGYYYHLAYAHGGTNDLVLVYDGSVDILPFSLGATGDITICNDERYGPDQSNSGSGVESRNIPARRNVALISYDISGLKAGGGVFSNVSFSHFSHDQNDEVSVYGIIEDLDLLDVESLTWNTAPGVQNDPTPELGAPVALDVNDLTDVLLRFTPPEDVGVRFSTDTSQALADLLNSDTDGIVTFLFAASAEDTQAIIRSREHSAGGSFLEGEIIPPLPVKIPVENASFELPGTDKQNNWDGGTNDKGTFVDVPSWSSDTMATDSGVETGWNASDGEWSGFLRGSDPSVWQLTSYVIGADDVIELKVDAKNNWQATTFLLSLYYDEAGVRVPVASVEVTLTDDMQEFSLVFSAADVPESVGKQLGIELNNVTPDVDSWAGSDNVRLLLY